MSVRRDETRRGDICSHWKETHTNFFPSLDVWEQRVFRKKIRARRVSQVVPLANGVAGPNGRCGAGAAYLPFSHLCRLPLAVTSAKRKPPNLAFWKEEKP